MLIEGNPYGDLVPDPAGLLDLPRGFAYRILSKLGQPMADGGSVPDRADGMGCFDIGQGEDGRQKLVLVRNHELHPGLEAGGTGPKGALLSGYSAGGREEIFPGGTTNLVLDAETLTVERQFRTLGGTIRNCSGGITPWGTWLTCEEPGGRALDLLPGHGWVFEVPAGAQSLVDAVPLKAMGRFNHEAACVDPLTGIVYMSEDDEESMLYRFVPDEPGSLAKGGKLQALGLTGGIVDSRNWDTPLFERGAMYDVRWIDLEDPESPGNDLREQAAAKGGLKIARGEGIHLGVAPERTEIYLCSTNGGAAKFGQILQLTIGATGRRDQFGLFFESDDAAQFNFGDNLTVQNNGHLIVCEDGYSGEVNHLRGVTPDGSVYPFARLRIETEPAGACFSPDGKWMFVNLYSPTHTLAITGPWTA
jgi:secreted PhoX family phosphatase